jgi:hypothetical protein
MLCETTAEAVRHGHHLALATHGSTDIMPTCAAAALVGCQLEGGQSPAIVPVNKLDQGGVVFIEAGNICREQGTQSHACIDDQLQLPTCHYVSHMPC